MNNLGEILEHLTVWAKGTGLKILISVLVLIVSFRVITRLSRVAEKRLLGGKKHMDKTLVTTLAYLVRIILKLAVALCIVGYLGVDTGGIAALVASLGVGVGLAVNGALSNLAGGVLILLTRPFKIDDYIEAQGFSGTVEDIHIVSTRILTPDNKVVYLPNGTLSSGSIVNYSEKPIRRIEELFKLPLHADFEWVSEILSEIALSDDRVLRDPSPMAVISESTESALVVSLRVWVKSEEYWSVKFDIAEKGRDALMKNGAATPYRSVVIIKEN